MIASAPDLHLAAGAPPPSVHAARGPAFAVIVTFVRIDGTAGPSTGCSGAVRCVMVLWEAPDLDR